MYPCYNSVSVPSQNLDLHHLCYGFFFVVSNDLRREVVVVLLILVELLTITVYSFFSLSNCLLMNKMWYAACTKVWSSSARNLYKFHFLHPQTKGDHLNLIGQWMMNQPFLLDGLMMWQLSHDGVHVSFYFSFSEMPPAKRDKDKF